jgi:exonuclease I
MWPLASHPTNKNELLVWDCSRTTPELRDLDADTLRLRLFTRTTDLPEGVVRLPMKSVHMNKSPMVVGEPEARSRRPWPSAGTSTSTPPCVHAAIAARPART